MDRPSVEVAIRRSLKLNTARFAFATYLVQMHNRIHPVFSDQILAFLDSLGGAHPLNDLSLYTGIELAIEPNAGAVVHLGLVRSSSQLAFDALAIEAIHRAEPFGPTPQDIRSEDGKVYIHWEFHRNVKYACSTLKCATVYTRRTLIGRIDRSPTLRCCTRVVRVAKAHLRGYDSAMSSEPIPAQRQGETPDSPPARRSRGTIQGMIAGGAVFVIAPVGGVLVTAILLQRAFGAVATADPAQKARLLAEAISNAMYSTAIGLAVGFFGAVVFVVSLVLTLRHGRV